MHRFLSAVIILGAIFSANAVNPLSRYGKCKNYVPASDCHINAMKGVWYVQQRPSNDDNYAHTCQAQFEEQVDWYTSFLYFYNGGKAVNRPIKAEYAEIYPGKYRGAITVEGEAVNIFIYFLYVDPQKVRVTYMCTDHPKANPNIDAILVSTREQCPLDSTIQIGTNVAANAYRQVNYKEISLARVVQDLDKCEPLIVYQGLDNPFLLN